LPARIPRSRPIPGAPVPSNTVPPRITRSNSARRGRNIGQPAAAARAVPLVAMKWRRDVVMEGRYGQRAGSEGHGCAGTASGFRLGMHKPYVILAMALGLGLGACTAGDQDSADPAPAAAQAAGDSAPAESAARGPASP